MARPHTHSGLNDDACEVTGERWQDALEDRAGTFSTGLTVLYLASFLTLMYAVIISVISVLGR
jgi:hypothetical protein